MQISKLISIVYCLAVLGTGIACRAQKPDLVVQDFEGTNYGDWAVSGTAFGSAPAQGTLPNQMKVDGFEGKQLANSYVDGDDSTGTLTSPPFTVSRKYIQFLIGGGGWEGKTCMNLLADGKVVRSATGPNTEPGGSEHLGLRQWDVSDLSNRVVKLQIVDQASGTWGHICVDQIIQTDRKVAGAGVPGRAQRALLIGKRYLNLPVKNGAPKQTMRLLVNGKVEREFKIELANDQPDWWAFVDVSAFQGQSVTVEVDRLPADSQGLALIEESDELKDVGDLYHEALRPQFHFTQRRGWNNDPNGMVYYQGTYHLFFQHNPYGWEWDNMHWGHATSRDLVHWTEQPEALYPDALGMIYSGSAAVDWGNTSGFGRGGQPPIVLVYTSAGNRFSQCLAYSADGGETFAKYAKNPVIPQITDGNRDPRVFWYEPAKHWVMVLWVERNGHNTIQFFASPDLKNWKPTGMVNDFFECPDFFELPVAGNPANKKWVLTAASSDYELGSFDGETFTPETAKLAGVQSQAFYAAQTFNDLPAADGRRIQIGWLRAPSPGMPFNQCMSVPLDLELASTPDGVRLTRLPVDELMQLRDQTNDLGAFSLKPGDSNALSGVSGELIELRAEFEPSQAGEVVFNICGASISYDAERQELSVNGHRAPALLRAAKQRLIIFVDRTTIEVFASDGLTYVPLPFLPKADDRSLGVQVRKGTAAFQSLRVYHLKSMWE
jgi:sucrose-6-phosphate hydrolase SacC (GH32 family)